MGGQKSIQLVWRARAYWTTTQSERETTRDNLTFRTGRTLRELEGLRLQPYADVASVFRG